MMLQAKPFQLAIASGRKECRWALVELSREAGQSYEDDPIGKICRMARVQGTG